MEGKNQVLLKVKCELNLHSDQLSRCQSTDILRAPRSSATRKVPCKFFGKDGVCPNSASCTYSHIPNTSHVLQIRVKALPRTSTAIWEEDGVGVDLGVWAKKGDLSE